MFHVGFMPEVVKMLQSVCFHCAKFRNHDRQARLDLLQEPCGKRRLTKASLLCKDLSSCSGKEGKGIVAVGCNFLQVLSCHGSCPCLMVGMGSACVCVCGCAVAMAGRGVWVLGCH